MTVKSQISHARKAMALLAGAVLAATLVPPTAVASETPPGTSSTWPTAVEDLGVIQEPVPLASSRVEEVRSGSSEVVLDEGESQLVVGLPDVGAISESEGVYVAPGDGGEHSVSVIPLADGVQVVLDITSDQAPTSYPFTVANQAGVVPTLTEGGYVALTNASGEDLGVIEAPWAYDAEGLQVPTHFEVAGDSIVQVVDHRGGDYAYPITADPSVKNCNLYTATCVKFNKSETKKIAALSVGAAGVAAFCGFIPNVVGKVACAAVVAPVYTSIRGTFVDAAGSGKCVEVKFNRIPPAINAPIGWKKVSC